MARDDPSQRRKTKRDKRAKAKFNRYKKGGRFRATKVNETTDKKKD